MTIEIILPPSLQALAGDVKNIEAAGATVGECLDELVRRYPSLRSRLFTGDGKLAGGINIYINGERVSSGALTRRVRDGDKVHLAYLIFGG